MQLLLSLNVISNILKILSLDEQFDIKLQISSNTDNTEYVNFSLVYYSNGVFVIYTRIIVSINEFEEITEYENESENWSFLLDKEYIKKILLLHKYWPKKFINFSIDFDVVTLKLVENISTLTTSSMQVEPVYTFITSFCDENIIIEPILLKHTCVVNIEEFKKLFELCCISNQKIVLELNNETLIVKNEHGNITASTIVSDVKKMKKGNGNSNSNSIVIEYQYIPFILNRLAALTQQTSKSKTKLCMLYLEKGSPFVIEYNQNDQNDNDNNNKGNTRIYLVHC